MRSIASSDEAVGCISKSRCQNTRIKWNSNSLIRWLTIKYRRTFCSLLAFSSPLNIQRYSQNIRAYYMLNHPIRYMYPFVNVQLRLSSAKYLFSLLGRVFQQLLIRSQTATNSWIPHTPASTWKPRGTNVWTSTHANYDGMGSQASNGPIW